MSRRISRSCKRKSEGFVGMEENESASKKRRSSRLCQETMDQYLKHESEDRPAERLPLRERRDLIVVSDESSSTDDDKHSYIRVEEESNSSSSSCIKEGLTRCVVSDSPVEPVKNRANFFIGDLPVDEKDSPDSPDPESSLLSPDPGSSLASPDENIKPQSPDESPESPDESFSSNSENVSPLSARGEKFSPSSVDESPQIIFDTLTPASPDEEPASPAELDSPEGPASPEEPDSPEGPASPEELDSPGEQRTPDEKPYRPVYETISPAPQLRIPEPRTMSAIRMQAILPRGGKAAPFPKLPWAKRAEVWDNMLMKDIVYRRDEDWVKRHQDIEESMRTILLDWLSEVCDVYSLHRETYHLAVDYIDRYLSTASNLRKSSLQLIGVTCLFIAAKTEEIYPPKLSEFAFVTDKACSEEDITKYEIVVLQRLQWRLAPHTSLNWLSVFLNIINTENLTDVNHSFILPQYPHQVFVNMARLLDLCLLDHISLHFNYCQLAAAVLCHMTSEALTLRVTKYDRSDFQACFDWMVPHVMVLRGLDDVPIEPIKNIDESDLHNIHRHNIFIKNLHEVRDLQEEILQSGRISPEQKAHLLITPPTSGKIQSKTDRDSM